MKKMMIAIAVCAATTVGLCSFSTGETSDATVQETSCSTEAPASSEATGDHEGKPCHATKSNGNRCDCRSCYGNNWGNYYCTRCGHAVNKHY